MVFKSGGRCCYVEQCYNSNKKALDNKDNISFHLFPKDEVIYNRWLTALNWSADKKPSKWALVCSQHFRVDDYLTPIIGKRPKSLKKSAVPSLYLSYGSPAVASFTIQDQVDVDQLAMNVPSFSYVSSSSQYRDVTQDPISDPLEIAVEHRQDVASPLLEPSDPPIKCEPEECSIEVKPTSPPFDTTNLYIKEEPFLTGNVEENDGILSLNSVNEAPTETAAPVYECTSCSQKFPSKLLLIQHLHIDNPERPCKLLCKYCIKLYHYNSILLPQLTSHTNEPIYNCAHCGLYFKYIYIPTDKSDLDFTCSTCGKVYQSQFSLRKHMILHSGHLSFGCPHCDMWFESFKSPAFKAHLKTHSTDRPFACSKCDVAYKYKKHLNEHMTVHKKKSLKRSPSLSKNVGQHSSNVKSVSNVTPSICDVQETQNNDLNFESFDIDVKEELTADMDGYNDGYPDLSSGKYGDCSMDSIPSESQKSNVKQNNGEALEESNDCNIEFKPVLVEELASNENLRNDCKDVSTPDDPKPATSTNITVNRGTCRVTPLEGTLDYVLPNLFCNFCWKATRSRLHLIDHFDTNDVNQPCKFSCRFCQEAFRSTSSLNQHLRSHSNVRPYKCPQCGSAFKLPETLSNHLKIHKNARNFLCSECGKAFNFKNNLEDHMLMHSNERSFGCVECGKWFKSDHRLAEHMKTHNSARPFACEPCGTSYKKNAHLKYHNDTRHRDEKTLMFKCLQCVRSFPNNARLRQHRKTKSCLHFKDAENNVHT